jgi:bacterioferritin
MPTTDFDPQQALPILNKILELELAGVVRYLHYSFMVFGPHRIPITKWLRDQANESMAHAVLAGEHVTSLGGHPSLAIGPLLETRKHDVDSILQESIVHERQGLEQYVALLKVVQGKSIFLEEYARELVASEEEHLNEITKMLRRPEKT